MSLYIKPVVFGKSPGDIYPQRWNFLGATGTDVMWYKVPLGWFTRQNSDGTITASPNSDFSAPTYDILTNVDGYMVFQTAGNPNPLSAPNPKPPFNPLQVS